MLIIAFIIIAILVLKCISTGEEHENTEGDRSYVHKNKDFRSPIVQKCPVCKSVLDEPDAKFCPICGARLSDD